MAKRHPEALTSRALSIPLTQPVIEGITRRLMANLEDRHQTSLGYTSARSLVAQALGFKTPNALSAAIKKARKMPPEKAWTGQLIEPDEGHFELTRMLVQAHQIDASSDDGSAISTALLLGNEYALPQFLTAGAPLPEAFQASYMDHWLVWAYATRRSLAFKVKHFGVTELDDHRAMPLVWKSLVAIDLLGFLASQDGRELWRLKPEDLAASFALPDLLNAYRETALPEWLRARLGAYLTQVPGLRLDRPLNLKSTADYDSSGDYEALWQHQYAIKRLMMLLNGHRKMELPGEPWRGHAEAMKARIRARMWHRNGTTGWTERAEKALVAVEVMCFRYRNAPALITFQNVLEALSLDSLTRAHSDPSLPASLSNSVNDYLGSVLVLNNPQVGVEQHAYLAGIVAAAVTDLISGNQAVPPPPGTGEGSPAEEGRA